MCVGAGVEYPFFVGNAYLRYGKEYDLDIIFFAKLGYLVGSALDLYACYSSVKLFLVVINYAYRYIFIAGSF